MNVSVLGRFFRNTTTSYKYLFFLALLKLLPKNDYLGVLSLKDIQLEILTQAWFPHNYFRLNFGAIDGISQALAGVYAETKSFSAQYSDKTLSPFSKEQPHFTDKILENSSSTKTIILRLYGRSFNRKRPFTGPFSPLVFCSP